MNYFIKRINREVELDDTLIELYQEIKEIKDSLFTIVIFNEYGNYPTKDVVSDKELSLLCNECILNELKVWNILSKKISYIETHYKQWSNKELQEIPFEER